MRRSLKFRLLPASVRSRVRRDRHPRGCDPVGKFPHWFTVRPDGQVLFVSLWDSHAVAAIDIASRRVLANIQFARGGGPKRILVARKP
jgi:hypothetical protein